MEKNRVNIIRNVLEKRWRRELKSRQKRKSKRFKSHKVWLNVRKELEGDLRYENIINKWLPVNISYMLTCRESIFYFEKVMEDVPDNNGQFYVPVTFSIIDNPDESYIFIKNVLGALLLQKYDRITIDYSVCKHADLSAQVLFDIILKDLIAFFEKCKKFKPTRPRVKQIQGVNVKDENVKKLLFSVGSPAIHSNKTIKFNDIIPYKLCIHDREFNGDPVKIREQKDLDTTQLVDYVIKCLKSLGRTLTPDRLEDLSTVIGEILINAEEHSTTKYRFSIGYFHEIREGEKHYGVFRLTILNFGKTIYEKFKDPNCPNKKIVDRMTELSNKYKFRNFFSFKKFEEETLWTLYALQEGVTSVDPKKYSRRGNGSIQFIDSFFNIKGRRDEKDSFSQMAILSGNTSIIFDGTYNITKGIIGGEEFNLMTFNNSGNIEDKPDSKYVKFVDNYFPGTIISAKILFNEDDLTEEIRHETK